MAPRVKIDLSNDKQAPTGLFLGDCLEVMKAIPDECIDSVVCDPPYGLRFMGIELNQDYFDIAQKRISAVRVGLL
jgi:site-specific DNA-methyltransferase (adenine-specific)